MDESQESITKYPSESTEYLGASGLVEPYEHHELDDIPRAYAKLPISSLGPFDGDSEDRSLLDNKTQSNQPTTAIPDRGKWARTKQYFKSRNPTTGAGRRQIKTDIARSGPISRANTDPRLIGSSGIRGKLRLQGWHFGVFSSAVAVTICLVAELIMLICALSLNRKDLGGEQSGVGILFTGDCAKVERITTILAIPLNIIATVLVATSNYVMQCLCAPTRAEVDKAHASGVYLNIGIPSVHNLLRNLTWKSALWLTLVLTTVPIHLLLNSAFFGALQANNYGVLIVSGSPSLNTDAYLSNEFMFNGTLKTSTIDSDFTRFMMSNLTAGNLQRLSTSDCFARYSNKLQSSSSNVLVVTKDGNEKYSTLPDFAISAGDAAETVDSFADFKLPKGVGLYFNPFTGNAVPVFNQSYHWTSPLAPQNTSGGIYLWPDSVSSVPNLLSVFSSFDWLYWMMTKEYKYDFNNTDILRAKQWDPTSWMCTFDDIKSGKACASGKHPQPPDPWLVTPLGYEVDYCLSEPTQEQCSLQYSFTILLIVIICDIAKIFAMAATLYIGAKEPLATLGDAIESFLQNPDSYTKGCCLMNQEQVRSITHTSPLQWQFWKTGPKHVYQHANRTFSEKLGPSASVWKHKTARWFSAPSRSRWITFAVLYIALFSASIAVLAVGVRDLDRLGIDQPFAQGFGTLNPNAIFAYPATFSTFLTGSNSSAPETTQTDKTKSLFADVVTVNTPQLLFSALYFLYNGLFTSMVTSAEWTRFAKVRKALRVSKPRVGQRSTYWLQLPWKFSLPLLAISVLLHWLVSRSLFLVRIKVMRWDGTEQPDRDISACGYSPLAILIVILMLALSLVVAVAAGWQKLTPGIPVYGTNSLAIAAACHYANEWDPNVSQKSLLWGVTKEADEELPGHCSMSDKDVGEPKEGMRYI